MSPKKLFVLSFFLLLGSAFILQFFWMPYYGSVEASVSYCIARYSFFLVAPLPILLFFLVGIKRPIKEVWFTMGISFGLRFVCDVCCWKLMQWLDKGQLCIPYFFDFMHVFACAFFGQMFFVNDKALLYKSIKKRLPLFVCSLLLMVILTFFAQRYINSRIIDVFLPESETYSAAFANVNLLVYAGSFFVQSFSIFTCMLVFMDILPVSDNLSKLCFSWFMLLPVVYGLGYYVKGIVHREYFISHSLQGKYEYTLDEELDLFRRSDRYRMEYEYFDLFRYPNEKSISIEMVSKYDLLSPTGEKIKTGFFVIPSKYSTEKYGNLTVGIYSPYHIVIYDNQNYTWYDVTKLHRVNEDPMLTVVLKGEVEKNSYLIFPYAASYLINHEPEFIIPYLERYAEAQYTDHELSCFGDIRPEYIRNVSRKLLNK